MSGNVVYIQRRLREIGRIRMGEKRVSAKGKEYPAAIDRFRFTSPSRGILDRMAHVVGGEVREWDGAPGDGEQFELYSETNEITVVIPPVADPYSQSYELWSAAGCQRRCDGERATVAVKQGDGDDAEIVMRERNCVCDADNRECKLTTRASFILPWAPSIGVWRLESHGYNAAVEMTGTLAYLALQSSQGVYVECRLRLEKRTKRVPGKPTSEFVVPVIDTDATPAELMSGVVAQPVALPRGERPALPVGDAPPADGDAEFTDPSGNDGDPGWGSAPEPPSGESARRGEDQVINQNQRKRLFAMSREAGLSTDDTRKLVAAHRPDGETSTGGLPVTVYDAICKDLETLIASGPAPVPAEAGEQTELVPDAA